MEVRFSQEDIEISNTLIKILRNQIIEKLKSSVEVGDYVQSVEEELKKYYTPNLVWVLTGSVKGDSIDVKTLKYNLQYFIAFLSDLQKYSGVITEYGIHQKMSVGETIEVEQRLEAPMVVNKTGAEYQEFIEKLIEVMSFTRRVNLATLEKMLVTRVDKKVFKVIIRHSYQPPVTIFIPIMSKHL